MGVACQFIRKFSHNMVAMKTMNSHPRSEYKTGRCS